MSRPKISQPYTIIKIPNELSDQIYEYKKTSKEGYATITEIVKIAIRDFLRENANGGCKKNKTSQKGNIRDGGEEKTKESWEKHENETNEKTRPGGNSKRSSTSADLT